PPLRGQGDAGHVRRRGGRDAGLRRRHRQHPLVRSVRHRPGRELREGGARLAAQGQAGRCGDQPPVRLLDQVLSPVAFRPWGFAAKISGCSSPSATLFTVPVISIEKPSPISMWIVPPGILTATERPTRPSLWATAADALELVPDARV